MIVILKGIFLTEDELGQIVELLNNLDVEIGSTITYPKDSEKVMPNMRSANYYLFEIRKVLGENN